MWNIFHESGLPHVVIVANGGNFSKKHGVTHFSATKESETTWKCVCADINVGELGMWRGYDNGLRHTAVKFIEKEKIILLSDTHKVSADVQGLCHNLNQLCIRHDRIYSKMESIGIKVDAFKRFNTFIFKKADSKEETENVHKKSSGKHKKSKESKSEKRSSRACGKFAKEVRERVLGDAVAELDKQKEGSEVPEQSAIDEVLRSRPGGCRIKNARKPFFPSLPAETVSADKDDETSQILMTERNMKQWQVSSEIQKPYNFDIPQIQRTEEPGIVQEWAMSPEAEVVITEQPKKVKDDNFEGKRRRESGLENERKKQRIDEDEDIVIYGMIPITRQVADILENQKQHEMLAKVHTTCKISETVPLPTEHDYIQTVVNPTEVIEGGVDVQELDSENISLQQKGRFDDTVWKDAVLDEDDNIVGFKNQPNLNVFIPQSKIEQATNRSELSEGSKIVEITEDVLTTPVEVTIITEEEDTEERENTQVEVHDTAKKSKQTSLAQFFTEPSTSKQRKHIEIKTKESVIDITGAQKELPDITVDQRSKTKKNKSSPAERSVLQKPSKRNTGEVIADVTGGEAPVKQRRAQTKSKGKQQTKASTGREIEKIIVFVTQNVDTSEVDPPVPEGERESHILYCDCCSFSTLDKRYFKKHNTWQCPLLTVVECLKCPEEGCESLFIHENSHQDHVYQHRGIFNYECPKCGKTFMLQNQLARHKRTC